MSTHSTETPTKQTTQAENTKSPKRTSALDVEKGKRTVRKKSAKSAQESHPSARKEHKQKQKDEKKKGKRVRRRILPIWLRIIIVLLLAAAALILGAGFGYSVLGDGAFKDIFDWDTWQHIIDIVEKE